MSTCSFTRLLKFDLGSNLFVLVSEFNNYVSIGFRTCLTYTTNQNEARLYPTKEGINLIHPQYRTLVGLKEKLSKGLQKRESLMESLGYDTSVTLSSVPKQQGKVVLINKLRNKVTILNRDQFKRWMSYINEIEMAIDTINQKIRSSKQISLNPYQDPFTQSSQAPPSSPLPPPSPPQPSLLMATIEHVHEDKHVRHFHAQYNLIALFLFFLI